MSDFPEKDNLNEETKPEAASEKSETESHDKGQETQSTLFVKHVYDTKKPAKNNDIKRIVTCVVAGILTVAVVLLGIKFLPAVLPENADSGTSSVTEAEEFDILKFADIVKPSTVNIDGEDVEVETNIKSVYLVNSLDEFTLLPQYVKAEQQEETSSDASSSSDKKTYLYDTEWRVDGLDTKLTMSDSIGLQIQECLTVKGIQEMENKFSSVEEYHEYYGITEALVAGCIIEFTDGTEDLTLKIGNSVNNGKSYYFVTSLSDTIYLIDSDYAKTFSQCSKKTFANPTIIEAIAMTDDNKSYFNETTKALARFDSLKVYGSMFGDTIYEFKMATGASADYMPYLMSSPYKRPASDEFVADILGFASSGLEATVMYSYAPTEEEMEYYRLDKPNGVIELTVGKYSYKLTIGGIVGSGTDSESITVMVDGKPQIFGIPVDSVDFIVNASNDVTKMFNDGFILEDIYTVKSVEMTDSTGTYKFDLTHNLREGESKVYDTVVKKGSTIMNTQSFKLIYQRVLMLSLTEYVLEEARTEPVFAVKFNFIEGGSKLVEFTESPDDIYHYTAWVDGTPLGEVIKSSVTDIIDCLDTYLSGGTVPDTW